MSIAIARIKLQHRLLPSKQRISLSLSFPLFSRSITAACISSGGEGRRCQSGYERSVSAWDGWRKKLEYSRACPIILSSWTTMSRCNAGKRLLHGNKRIYARCMMNKEERERERNHSLLYLFALSSTNLRPLCGTSRVFVRDCTSCRDIRADRMLRFCKRDPFLPTFVERWEKFENWSSMSLLLRKNDGWMKVLKF